MALLGLNNQLLQIDTGNPRTYLYNSSLSPVSIYAGLGENQILGQRYANSLTTVTNPSGAPAIYMLVKYSSVANPAVQSAPAPVYWIDGTYTAVSGVSTESLLGLNGVAGYLLLNSTDLSTLTNTILNSSICLIQVAGYLKGAVAPGGTPGVGNPIIGAATNFASAAIAAGTAPTYRTLGIQQTAVAGGVCDVLVNSDIL
jgi:hypothetical protein